MSLQTIRRLASDILGVGATHIKILDAKQAGDALTRDDVRALIKENVIVASQKKGIGRAGARWKQSRKKLGRRVGLGSVKGRAFSGITRKQRWILKVRSQRTLLQKLRPSLKKGEYRKMYLMVKGNQFRTKRQLGEFVREKKMLK